MRLRLGLGLWLWLSLAKIGSTGKTCGPVSCMSGQFLIDVLVSPIKFKLDTKMSQSNGQMDNYPYFRFTRGGGHWLTRKAVAKLFSTLSLEDFKNSAHISISHHRIYKVFKYWGNRDHSSITSAH